MNINQVNTGNYLVPSTGTTHAITLSGNLSAIPYVQNWATYSNDNAPFSPQSAFIDNSQGVGALTINIQPINYNVIVPAGTTQQVQFPAPDNQIHNITGNGQATIVYVDFPVLPSTSAQTVSISGQPVAVSISGQPINTTQTASTFSQTTPTITNVSSLILAANTANRTILLQNNDTSGIVYLGFGAAATTSGLKILSGASVELKNPAPNNAIYAIGSIASNANVVLLVG